MEGAGLRSAEVVGCRWQDIDLVNGRVLARRKGAHWQWVPLDPDVVERLRECFREIEPDLDDHVFTVEVEQWVSQDRRVRRRKDPKQAASGQALWRMVKRVCARAGVRELSPTHCDTASQIASCARATKTWSRSRALLGHSRPDTTQGYTDELGLGDEIAEALHRAADARHAQASPKLATLEAEITKGFETLEWRRRESNPRPRTHRPERLQA